MVNIALVNLKRMLKDKKALIGILIAPVIIMFIFGFIVPNGESDMSLDIGVVDYANSTESQYIINQLNKDTTYNVRIMEDNELNNEIKDKFISMGLVIPKKLGKDEDIKIIKTENSQYQLFKNKINNILRELEFLKGVPALNEKLSTPIQYINNYVSTKLDFIMGFIINFMMYSMIYIITELMDLKKTNILRRCYTAPYSSFSLLGGIMLSMFFLLGLQIIIVNIMSYILFKEFLIQNIIGGTLLFTPFILVVLGIGVIISKIWKNSDLTPVIANLIIIPLGMVSGTFMPKGMLPSFLDKFAFLAPQYWIGTGIEKLNQGQMFEIMPNVAILTLIALCLLSVSSYNFKAMLQD